MALRRDESGQLHIESPLMGESLMRQRLLEETETEVVFLAPHGGIKIGHDDLTKLPTYLRLGIIPVMHAMPPYGLWEEPPAVDRIPPHRTDVGTLLTAEVLGARRCILVNDERGLYTDDPKRNPEASFIAEITADELLAQGLHDLPVERAMLVALARAKSVQEVLIVNGRESGTLTATLHGENPGTRIRRGI